MEASHRNRRSVLPPNPAADSIAEIRKKRFNKKANLLLPCHPPPSSNLPLGRGHLLIGQLSHVSLYRHTLFNIHRNYLTRNTRTKNEGWAGQDSPSPEIVHLRNFNSLTLLNTNYLAQKSVGDEQKNPVTLLLLLSLLFYVPPPPQELVFMNVDHSQEKLQRRCIFQSTVTCFIIIDLYTQALNVTKHDTRLRLRRLFRFPYQLTATSADAASNDTKCYLSVGIPLASTCHLLYAPTKVKTFEESRQISTWVILLTRCVAVATACVVLSLYL